MAGLVHPPACKNRPRSENSHCPDTVAVWNRWRVELATDGELDPRDGGEAGARPPTLEQITGLPNIHAPLISTWKAVNPS